ncbi:cupin domain-containing protein [Diaphorobacter caeni]|uniref:cupin domain-containing protein n=1 Tax=Diaphorobacter caeni TaxID=2784387 RepID=UPI00188EB515|nr:cupin domain-containing protein [Diaphorobacter caeni]MBF5005105.1 cupin domain-containing protein [Diaphorobacter caeni]
MDTDNITAQALIEQLGLVRHPEGGWYRETYRASEMLASPALPARFSGDRSLSTAIYFLLSDSDISSLHRIKADEVWHFYAGSALNVHCIFPDGVHRVFKLGPNIAAGEQFQAVVPAGCWFGAELAESGFALVGCTVAPGFDFADFELGQAKQLCNRYPQHKAMISRLTRA